MNSSPLWHHCWLSNPIAQRLRLISVLRMLIHLMVWWSCQVTIWWLIVGYLVFIQLSDHRSPSPFYASLSAAPAPPPHFAQLSSPFSPLLESFELATENVPESESETLESPTFMPEDWIKQFTHNTTHVNIASGNETFNLLWTDELVYLKI